MDLFSQTMPAISRHTLASELKARPRFERLRISDVRPIVEIIKRTLMLFPEEGQVLASTIRRLPCFYQHYNHDGASYFLMKGGAKGTIIGGVGILPFAGLDPSEGICEVRELVVDAPYRGQGFGRQLVELAIQKATEMGYRRVYLEATSQMQHAQALFRRSGFRPIESRLEGQPEETACFPSYFVLETKS